MTLLDLILASEALLATLPGALKAIFGPQHGFFADMLAGLDALLIDLVDVGCRVYIFFSTLVALRRRARDGVWVLDLPNLLRQGGERGPSCPARS